MASRCGLRLGSFEALVAILFLAATVSASAAAGSPDRPAPGPPLVLPLTRSYRNASRLAASLRRGLGGGTRPNARMRLHDDLLTNGSVQPDFFYAGLCAPNSWDAVLDLTPGGWRLLSC
jgi:hypothetical protein